MDPMPSRRERLPICLVLAILATLAACAGGEAEPLVEEGPAEDAGGVSYAPGPPVANPPSAAAGGRTTQAARAQDRAGRTDVEFLGFNRGSPDASVRVVEFSDFGCGYCSQFHRESWPVLERDYVASGKVLWKMIPFDVGLFPHARQAVLAGECSGEQDHFDTMRERLFREQKTWKGGSAAEALALFRRLADEEGLDTERFNRCMAQGWRAARVDASNAMARQLGVRGTPTFYILGYGIIPGALPTADFADVLDRVLATAASEPGS